MGFKALIVAGTLASSLLAAGRASAQWQPPQQPIARVTYDCVPGPGYMRISVMDANLFRQTKVIWVGPDVAGRADDPNNPDDLARDADLFCTNQQNDLRATRGTIALPTLFGVCYGYAATDVWYVRRYAVNGYGAFAFQGDVNVASRSQCLDEAKQTNANAF